MVVSEVTEPDTSTIQTEIARDITFLEAEKTLKAQRTADQEEENQLIEQFWSGKIEASPEAIEAAPFLVELLLEKPE
jgi:hypothetical protein